MTFTTRPDPRGHLRDGLLDALAGLAVRAADARARRQRLRRGRCRRLRAARRRAAPQRSRRRPARDRGDGRRPDPARALRPGAGPGRRDTRGVRRHGPRPRPRLGTAGRGRPRARSTPGCSCCATTARSRWRPSSSRRSATPATAIRCWPASPRPSTGCRTCSATSWTTSADLWLRDGRVPRAGELFANPVYAVGARAARRRGGGRRHRRGRAGAGGPRRLGARLRGGGGRGVPQHGLAALRRARCSPGWSAATTSRPSPRPGRSRSPRSGTASRSRRPTSGARAPHCCRCWRCSTCSDRRRSTRPPRDGHPRHRRVLEAGDGRPGGLVRRPQPGLGRRPAGRRLRGASARPWSGRSPIPAYDRGRRAVASRGCRGTCSACSPARPPAARPT